MLAMKVRRAVTTSLAVLASSLLIGTVVALPSAQAAAGDLGTPGPSTVGAGTHVTGEKPESKLWWHDGRWWAVMYQAATTDYRLAWLDRASSPARWVITGAVADDRARSRADVLWSGGKLYVASHATATDSVSYSTGKPTRLYRFSYSPASASYSLDAGFPALINNVSSETLVIDRDGAGRLWATWTQDRAVYLNATTTPGNDASWGTPFVLPAEGANNLDADDISTLTEFGGRIGVLWSSQRAHAVDFSEHAPGDPVTAWSPRVTTTVPGPGQADDHVNIKSLQSDDRGRLFAVIKTGLEASGSSAPQIVVLSRGSTGGWSRATFGTVSDCHTRPVLMLDSTNDRVHVYATAPDSGCAHTGTPGTIFTKTSSMSSLSFPPGRGTPVMRDSTSANLNDVTAAKQTVNATTGLVLLASDDVKQRYWFSDQSLGGSPSSPSPTASPSPSPTASASPTPTGGVRTVTLTATADGWVDSANASRSYGSASTLEVDGKPASAAYLKFDATGLGGSVQQAVLRLRVSSSGSTGAQSVRTVASTSWTESALTWSTRPAVGSAIGSLSKTRTNTTYDVPLTASAVQPRLGGPLSLALDSSSTDGVDLASRETSTPPQLVLTVADGTGGTTSPSPTATASSSPTPTPTSTTPPPQTVVLTPTADGWVDSADPSRNHGSNSMLSVDGSPATATYLKFNVDAYAGRTVQSATLRLRVSTSGSVGPQAVRTVSDVMWTETGLTWSTRPAVGSSIGSLGATSTGTTYDVPLSAAAIQDRLAGLLALAMDSSSSDGVDLASRETATPPQLVLVLR